jgi:hypothetical protein
MSEVMEKLGITHNQWQSHNDSYESVIWKGDPACTKTEWDNAVKEVENDYKNTQYQRDRKYPELGEQFDLLFKDIDSGKVSKDGGFYKAIKSVKDKHPKPSE